MKARRSMRRIVSPEAKPLERRDVLGVEAESPFPAIGEPVPQGCADRAKCDLPPGNPFLVEEGDLEGLFTGPEAQVQQPAEVEEVHLVRPRHRDHAERRAELDAGAGFLERLAQRRLASGLVVLHEAGGQGPVAVARLDGAPAEENFSFKLWNAAYDQLGILVVDLAAVLADPARQRVPRRHALHHRGRAVRAELHARSRRLLMVLSGVKPRRSTGAPSRLIQ